MLRTPLLLIVLLGRTLSESPFLDDESPRAFIDHAKYLLHVDHQGSRQALAGREASGAGDACLVTPICNATNLYRSFDGSCNNQANPHWGQAGTPFKRLLPKKHSLIGCGKTSFRLPNPRSASRLLIRRGETDNSDRLSQYLMVWGQIIDHDLELTPLRQTAKGEFIDCCNPFNKNSPDCCPIQTPNDPFYGRFGRPKCLPFLRSRLVAPKSCRGTPDIENSNTAWIDGSFLYGSTAERAKELRKMEDGEMKMNADTRGRLFPPITLSGGFKMEFGDNRGDVHIGFTMLTTAFLRYHNVVAKALKGVNPHWDDEKLFQETRKIIVALIQQITYTQFMSGLLGEPNNVKVNLEEVHEEFYEPRQDGSISMAFGTAAYRLHTLIAGFFQVCDPNYNVVANLRLRDMFHNPMALVENADTFDGVMRGLCNQPLRETNNMFTQEMTEWLFAGRGENFGLDIVALNIQRGRDHQLPGYTTYRQHCQLGAVNFWEDMTDLIHSSLVERLLHAYSDPNDVDLYLGGFMEDPVVGSVLGPTVHCIVREQFEMLRNGDRFFYTRPGVFSERQLKSIKQMTLASVLCRTADNPAQMSLPKNVFLRRDGMANSPVRCDQHTELDFEAWRQM